MRRSVILVSIVGVFVLLVGLFPSKSAAESAIDRYMTGGHFNLELSDDSITDTSKFEAELELRLRYEGLSAFVRGSNDRPFAFQREPFELDKWGFNYELNDDWQVTGGDYSLIFGRGTALDAVENRQVDRDAQLNGGMVKGDLGDMGVTAFWGTHRSDGVDYYLTGVNTTEGDPSDELWGGRADFDFKDLNLGLGWIDSDITRFGTQESTIVTELDGSWRIEDFSVYYETAFFNRNELEGSTESVDGRAQLAQLIYAEPGFSMEGSWVRYDKARFDYGTAPSLKRYDIDNPDAHPDDETGYRLDCRVSPESWDGNSLRALYADLNGIRNQNQDFGNYFIEWVSPQTEEWTGSLSYDHISGMLLYFGAVSGTDESVRGTIDGPFPMGGSFHFSARFRTLESKFSSDDEVELGFDWHVSPEFTVGLIRETSTRPTEPPPPGIMGIPTESPGEWNSAFLRWAPDPMSQFELVLGSQRGGFQCAGGTCAQVPPFKGVRFTYYRNL